MKKLIRAVPGLAVILVGDKMDSYRWNRNIRSSSFLRRGGHMDKQKIMNAVSVEKDVDGFHPLNIARLERELLLVPCVPKGYIELLHGYKFEIKGKRVVVIGRSKKFCIPIALLLQGEDATVTIIHSKTLNPQEITRQADIVISAFGKPNMVRGSWIKPGSRHQCWDQSAPPGSRFRKVGDICYEEVCISHHTS
ncbi:unnamed protein product [Arabis nemorensis]|uniref:methenyltetrahydrofolate cyclohydrolase n=1 Tax=Arabis nemorensis TaxID=586526 RepID=A0A565BEU9_9BRAS|nr:unnamed protein product [Arabis nemorensis]